MAQFHPNPKMTKRFPIWFWWGIQPTFDLLPPVKKIVSLPRKIRRKVRASKPRANRYTIDAQDSWLNALKSKRVASRSKALT